MSQDQALPGGRRQEGPSCDYRLLLEERIIVVGSEVNIDVASAVIAQMLFLQLKDGLSIKLHIRSPGGQFAPTLAVYETMQKLTPPIASYCEGAVSGAPVLLLAAGARGSRFALPSAWITLQDPLGGKETAEGAGGGAEELRMQYYAHLARHTGKTVAQVKNDCDHGICMSAEQARDYGIVDTRLTDRDLLKTTTRKRR